MPFAADSGPDSFGCSLSRPSVGSPVTARYDRKDVWHQRAKREGFRSRAAHKLEQLQKKHRVLRRGDAVIDLGCWPGGWMQVAAAAVGASGRIVGVDLAAIDPPLELANTIALQGDLSDAAAPARLIEALRRSAAAVVLSDAAPVTGIRATDRAREEALLEAIEGLLPSLLRPGGNLIVKVLEGPEAQAAIRRLRSRFTRATTDRPDASRAGTSERYLIASGYLGPASPQATQIG